MKIEELQQYQGINPKPRDFDTFWRRGVSLAKSHCATPQFGTAEVSFKGVECFNLFYNGLDGARIHAKYLRPKAKHGKCPLVFLFHGYTGNAGDWWEKLAWINQGFAVVAMDCRGQSGLSVDSSQTSGLTYTGQFIKGLLDEPERMVFCQMFLDIVILAEIMKALPEIDETKLAAHGGSQGGALSLVCAALVPEIRKVAVLYPFLTDYKKAYEIGCEASAYSELIPFFRAHDPRHERKQELFEKLGYIDVQNFSPMIQADVLWGVGLADTACPPITQFAAYNQLNCRKEIIIYPDYGHEFLPEFVDKCFLFIGALAEK